MVGLRPDLKQDAGDHTEAWSVGDLAKRDAKTEANRADSLPYGVRVMIQDVELDPRWVPERLLSLTQVASAWALTMPPPAGLRPRRLKWPVRITVAGLDEHAADNLDDRVSKAADVPPGLYELRRWEVDRRATDVLVIDGPLSEAAQWAVAESPVAHTVIVLDHPASRWPVVAGALAMIRGATAAGITALAPEADVGHALGTLVRELSHANHLDVALTTAFDRGLFLNIEAGALEHARLREVARTRAHEVAMMARALPPMYRMERMELRDEGVTARAMPPLAAEIMPSSAVFADAAEGPFTHETMEAAAVAAEEEHVAAAIEAQPLPSRFLQAVVEPQSGDGPEPKNAFAAGVRNDVSAWIGPEEADAIVDAVAFDESSFDWGAAESYKLTVVFAPQLPEAKPQRAEVHLFKAGPTKPASFHIHVPDDATEVAARIVVLHRNRVLQTAVLHGAVGQRAVLEERVVVHGAMGRLDDRRPFDLALVANHDARNKPKLLRNASAKVTVDEVSVAVKTQIGRITDLLDAAVGLESKGTLDRYKTARELVRNLAEAGSALRKFIAGDGHPLDALAAMKRISVLTVGDSWSLPIELVYAYDTPRSDALCPNYIATKGMGPCTKANCPPMTGSRDFVCPLGFWGLSKTIERYHVSDDQRTKPGGKAVLLGDATATHTPLKVTRVAFAADNKVTPREQNAVATALGVEPIADWGAWQTELGTETQLLVLLPHTQYKNVPQPSLFIGKEQRLGLFDIDESMVTGGHDVHPLVVLFGCKTTGDVENPSGFVSQFMTSKSAVVFSSLTKLLGTHAADMAKRVTAQLRADAKPRPIADRLTEFRRTCVWDSLIAALAVTAYGDADWSV
jgi:hypothetical protein